MTQIVRFQNDGILQNPFYNIIFMKKNALFFNVFLRNVLGKRFKNLRFWKSDFFWTKNQKKWAFLDDFNAHPRARRPLHDRQFQTPFFRSLVFGPFLELEYEKKDSWNFGIKGYPLYFLFFRATFWAFSQGYVWKNAILKKASFSTFRISGTRDSVTRIPGTGNPESRKWRFFQKPLF